MTDKYHALRSIVITLLLSSIAIGVTGSSEKPVPAEQTLEAIRDCMDRSPDLVSFEGGLFLGTGNSCAPVTFFSGLIGRSVKVADYSAGVSAVFSRMPNSIRALKAAFCSASFLFEPQALGKWRSEITTSSSKHLLWSGPFSSSST